MTSPFPSVRSSTKRKEVGFGTGELRGGANRGARPSVQGGLVPGPGGALSSTRTTRPLCPLTGYHGRVTGGQHPHDQPHHPSGYHGRAAGGQHLHDQPHHPSGYHGTGAGGQHPQFSVDVILRGKKLPQSQAGCTHRFRVFRALARALGVSKSIFPRTYRRQLLGIRLSTAALVGRAQGLQLWIEDVLKDGGAALTPAQAEVFRSFFRLPVVKHAAPDATPAAAASAMDAVDAAGFAARGRAASGAAG